MTAPECALGARPDGRFCQCFTWAAPGGPPPPNTAAQSVSEASQGESPGFGSGGWHPVSLARLPAFLHVLAALAFVRRAA